MTNQEIQESIMGFCRDLQRQHPDWMFAMAFSECQRQHPEWFEDREATRDAIDLAHKEGQREKEEIAVRRIKELQQTFNGVAAAGADSEVNPKDRAEMVALANRALQQRINAAVADIQSEKPGTSFQDAYAKAKMRHPGLFLPDDAAEKAEEDGLDKHLLLPGDKRAALAQKIMDNHPGTMFGEALDHLKRTRPDMFDVPGELASLRKQLSYA